MHNSQVLDSHLADPKASHGTRVTSKHSAITNKTVASLATNKPRPNIRRAPRAVATLINSDNKASAPRKSSRTPLNLLVRAMASIMTSESSSVKRGVSTNTCVRRNSLVGSPSYTLLED
jgi:hypothetical protein